MDCGTWWFDHVGQTYLYAISVRQDDLKEQADEMEKLLDGAEAWGKLIEVPAASELMNRHVGDFKCLVDGAFSGDQPLVDSATERLLAGVEEQAELYRKSFRDFPVEEWNKLFLSHVTATGGYVLALAAGDAVDFRQNYDRVILGRNALARFWTRLCSR